MLLPLTEFICDTCRQIIKSPQEGWMEWISLDNPVKGVNEIHSFRIVHQKYYSPLKENSGQGCYQHGNKSGRNDNGLNAVIRNDNGISYLLSLLDPGPYHLPTYGGFAISDMRNYVETFRRLTIPYYEEARTFWSRACQEGYFQDDNELAIYKPENLQKLISYYSNRID